MKLFGTDGIRGKPGFYPLLPDIIERIGYFSSKITKAKNVLLGKDTRESSSEIELHLIEGLKTAGCNVFKLGVITTPGVSYLTKNKGDLGIIITASHNPYYENGIKFFLRDGCKMSDGIVEKIEYKIQNPENRKRLQKYGSCKDAGYLVKDYKEFLKDAGISLSGLKAVVDTACGSGYEIFPDVLSSLGCEVIAIFNNPDGRNINRGCGSLYPEEASKVVVSEKADIGLCLDGDGDRLIAIDEEGNIFDGDFLLALFASYFKEKGINIVVTTQMANMALYFYLKSLGIELIRADVGDRWVYEKMKENQAILGGEPSGHIIFSEYLPTGDGILTSLKLMEIMKEKGSLSSLKRYKPYPLITINIKVKEKPPISDIPKFSEAIAEGEASLSPFGRIFVRYSGTEPLLRIMIEGRDENLIKEIGRRLTEIVEENIGE